MKLVLSSDHAGIDLRQYLVNELEQAGHECLEVGAPDGKSYDYPDAADDLVKVIREGRAELGIVICGTGIGISIRANRHMDIRCALCTTEFMATMARNHNAANVLALGARVVGTSQALSIVNAFLAAEVSEESRHLDRVRKLSAQI
ncbi:MAG TPA: ribose 5-phosphate isomerase B [Fimbriimonas sp.]|nr:ribose 5-phosphate isomerase B [Fimbriimonas sp.]